MKKTLITILVVFIIVFLGALYENDFLRRQFNELNEVFVSLYEKIDDDTANKQDVLAVQQNWFDKKKYLHAFIPHGEIKEIDLWLAEAVTFVDQKNREEALSKVQVLIVLSEQIPHSFSISFENIL